MKPIIYIATICLCGCPLGTPMDHYRPPGHGDITIAVSPSGDELVFNAPGLGGRDLYIMKLSDRKVERVAETPEYETDPSFSNDGKWIVYSAGIPGDRADHLFKMRRDGSDKTQLTDSNGNDTAPQFSPDGSMVVFTRDKTYIWGGLAANWEPGGVLCLIESDGSNLRELTPDEQFTFQPQFSADGKQVTYSTLSGLATISLVDGSVSRLFRGPAGAVMSGDATKVAYLKGQYERDVNIYVANTDGSSEYQLTNSGGCYRPVFGTGDNSLYFFRIEWPNGYSGVPKRNLWESDIAGRSKRLIADYHLFDAPLDWKPKSTPEPSDAGKTSAQSELDCR